MGKGIDALDTQGHAAGILGHPARLLSTDRAVISDRLADGVEQPGIASEVFQQAEALFGGAEVSPAEFASRLHFAAKVLHDAYADRIAAAAPGMPWRTVRAWWRPVGKRVPHPNRIFQDRHGLR
ncbi:hypothetical protein AB0D04_27615 [Streptomyces sp. NPDC048483]|uniref:hypothetical protein n=1 Tax=Streptomyces sp. NPDC048483 TaxID=3154927 RepID=UPI00343A961C